MTTTVNRVYVDPAGKVRMSPTGWTIEPTPMEGECTESFFPKLHAYEQLLEKTKEESIPFEDQDRAKIAMHRTTPYHMAKNGEFYTIEPIQVELQHQFYHGGTWHDCAEREYFAWVRTRRIVARIVTEEEKPEIQLCKQCGGEIIEAKYTLPSVIHNFCSSECTKLFYSKPAPVVDKPGYDSQDHLWAKVAAECNWIESEGVWHVIERLKQLFTITPKSQTVQQPTEWIPVSERLPETDSTIEVLALCGKSMYVLDFISNNDGTPPKFYLSLSYPTRVFHDFTEFVTAWRPLPEPPKP